MRPDMSKLIVERPRHKSAFGKSDLPKRVLRRAAKLDPENAVALRGMRRAAMVSRGKHLKSLNENLAPLRRFLHGAVGRPWSDVHSEICRNIRLSSAVQLHVLQHIGDFVETPSSPPTRHWRPELWVDPSDGVLKYCAGTPQRRPPRKVRMGDSKRLPLRRYICKSNSMRHLWQLGDSWFRIECRGRYVDEDGAIFWSLPGEAPRAVVWNARLPAWFRELLQRSDHAFWLNSWGSLDKDAESQLLRRALGPDRFPIRHVEMHATDARRELRRGLGFVTDQA